MDKIARSLSLRRRRRTERRRLLDLQQVNCHFVSTSPIPSSSSVAVTATMSENLTSERRWWRVTNVMWMRSYRPWWLRNAKNLGFSTEKNWKLHKTLWHILVGFSLGADWLWPIDRVDLTYIRISRTWMEIKLARLPLFGIRHLAASGWWSLVGILLVSIQWVKSYEVERELNIVELTKSGSLLIRKSLSLAVLILTSMVLHIDGCNQRVIRGNHDEDEMITIYICWKRRTSREAEIARGDRVMSVLYNWKKLVSLSPATASQILAKFTTGQQTRQEINILLQEV